MRLKGFELPIQFYNLETGTQIFESNTGHHFHSFYMDTLFYFGLIGLVMIMILIIIPIYKILVNHNNYSPDIISLTTFVFSGLILVWRIDCHFITGQ